MADGKTRKKWAHKASDGFIVEDRRPGRCLGCHRRYVPRVGEAVCPDCVASIVRDPDRWLDKLLVTALTSYEPTHRPLRRRRKGSGNGYLA